MTLRTILALTCAVASVAASAFAQQPDMPDSQDMQMPMPMPMPMPPGHSHDMMPENPLGLDQVRDGSGTSWLPDATPMQGVMRQGGPWMLMLHGNAFLQFIKTGTDRGDDQFGSINWVMGMAQRDAAGGQIQLRAMFSAEPATVGRCGYPTLLQSGESCRGTPLHDRQHPHDLFMELSGDYRRAINTSVAFELYGGPAAEPALGPTAFPHRPSAMPNPIAPISHHWLDSSHVSFGVITGGVYGRKWKAEASVFNGREPDDKRYDLDLAALDSYSGRFWFLPAPQWALQVSAGHLKDVEPGTDGASLDVNRITASATYHRLVNDRLWATTMAWGRNAEAPDNPSIEQDQAHSTSAFTIETAADLTTNDTLFARGEVTGKTSTDLALPLNSDTPFTVGKIQFGYTRWIAEGLLLRAGIGGAVGIAFMPEDLKPFYGSRTGGEFSVFLTVRPFEKK